MMTWVQTQKLRRDEASLMTEWQTRWAQSACFNADGVVNSDAEVFTDQKIDFYSLSCHDAVLDSCHSTCRRAQGSTNISHTHFICGKQLYTAKSYAKYFSETVQEFRAERDRKVTHQSGTFPEKYKQPYNCQRQKTLPASAYAAMGL